MIVDPQLITGDCREVLADMEGSSIDCCVTSPPYWGLRDYGVDRQIGLEETVSEYVTQLIKVFTQVRRVLKDDGTLWLNMGDAYAGSWGAQSRGQPNNYDHSTISGNQIQAAPITTLTGSTKHTPGLKSKDLIGLPWRVAFALQASGWYLRSDIIWHKPNPMPSSVKDRPTTAHEYLFLLAKSERYFYDHEAIAEDAVGSSGGASFGAQTKAPAGWQTGKGSHGTIHSNGRTPSKRDLAKPRPVQSRTYFRPEYEKRNKRSVWTIPTQAFHKAHFAVFPEKLVEPCILAGCREEGVVLDPFMGSGTTGKVAIQHGRNFVGIELNSEYVEIARSRFEQKRLFS